MLGMSLTGRRRVELNLEVNIGENFRDVEEGLPRSTVDAP